MQSLALVIVVAFTAGLSWRYRLGGDAVAALGFIVLTLVFAALQLVPLPPALWQALPGRQLLAQGMRTVWGSPLPWSLSLSPQDSRSVLLDLLPPIAMFIIAITLDGTQRKLLAMVAVAIGAGSAALGVLQLGRGDGSFLPYGFPPFDRLPGLFANYNHQATLLACCMVLAVALYLGAKRRAPARILLGLLLTMFVAGAVITSSRAGVGLLVGAALCCAFLWLRATYRDGRGGRAGARISRPAMLLGCAGIAIGVGVLIVASYRFDIMAGRFALAADDQRFLFWQNIAPAVRAYFPFGSGLGTFDLVYRSVEPLKFIDPAYVNHAHDDYIELVLEMGLGGLVLIALFFIWFGWRAAVVLRRPAGAEGAYLATAGAMVILLILLHSIVDYPLRTHTIGCLFALACALLVDSPRTRIRERISPGDEAAPRRAARTPAQAGRSRVSRQEKP